MQPSVPMAVPLPLTPSEIVRIRGERWRVRQCRPFGVNALLDVEGHDLSNRGAHACFVLPCEPIDRLPPSGKPLVVRPARWRHAARAALTSASPQWASLRAAPRADVQLLAFQLEPVLALVQGDACRFLLADAVGLGKTIQAGLMVAESIARRPSARILIVTPAGLRRQWSEELRSRFGIAATILDGAEVARLSARLPVTLNPWATCQVAITSIDFVKRSPVLRGLETLVWDLVIFDEAHGLAGRSDRSAAASVLGNRARALVMATATPHSGDDTTFAHLCALGALGPADPLLVFCRSRADAGIAGQRRTTMLRVQPNAAELAMHDALMAYGQRVWSSSTGTHDGARLAITVLARRACSSASSLVRSIERRIALLEHRTSDPPQPTLPFAAPADQDDEPEALLAVPGLRDPRDEQAHLDWILLLARDASQNESKPAALRRLLTRTSEPAIVFTEYRDTLQHLAEVLSDFPSVQLHGGLTERERQAALRGFVEGPARLLLATDTAGEGLNLHQRCRLVINLELPWTPLRHEQRAGRVDRMGQRARAHVVSLVAAHTSEERVIASLHRREDRIRTTMRTMRRPPDEREVAECVFTGSPASATSTAHITGPPGIVTGDRRRHAQDEVVRLEELRRLSRHRVDRLEDRGVMTRLRRLPPRRVWAFRVVLCDRDGRLILDSLIGAQGAQPGPESASVSGHPAARTRALLDVSRELQAIVDAAATRLQRELRIALDQPLQCWRHRENGLAERIRRDHGRLAATGLQRGLFDRRAERESAHQQALLDEAIHQSALRLEEIDACTEVRAANRELALALLLDV